MTKNTAGKSEGGWREKSNDLNNCFATILKNALFPFGLELLSRILQIADSAKESVISERTRICRSKYSLANIYCPNLWFPERLKLFVKEGENSKWLWQTWRQVVKYMLSIEIGWEHIQIGILCRVDIVKHKYRPEYIINFFWANKYNCKKTVAHRLFPLTDLVEAWGLCGAWNKKEWVFSYYRKILL